MPNRKKDILTRSKVIANIALKESGKCSYYDQSGQMEMETVAEPHKSDILSASARKLTMSNACESSSSCEERRNQKT